MTGRTRRAALALALALGAGGASGCAYFNAMYNAYHYQSLAEASERAGRLAEARERWDQAAMHAESLTARHPNSRWVESALLVRGRALVHLEYYSDAVPILQDAARRARSSDTQAEALTLLGQAELAIGRPQQAKDALDSAVAMARGAVLADALMFRGRAQLALGRPDSALDDLSASTARRARYDLARAELLVHDTATAGATFDGLVRDRPYLETEWRAGLDSLAAAGAGAHVALLVDSLGRRRDLTDGMRARLFLDDGQRRLAAGDSAGAAARFAEVEAVAADSADGKTAIVALSRLSIADATDDSVLARETERLQSVVQQGGSAGFAAQGLLAVLQLADDYANAPASPDATWFRRCELLRDSLGAARLAAADFADMARRFPESPWTPKGLVAAIAGGYPGADSLRALLEGTYARSPYTRAAAGDTAGASAYAQLEDSLRQVLAQRDVERFDRPGAGRVRRGDEPLIRRSRQPDRPASPSGAPGSGPPRPED